MKRQGAGLLRYAIRSGVQKASNDSPSGDADAADTARVAGADVATEALQEPISVGRLLWLMVAGVPVLGSVAWWSLARRTGDQRHVHRTRLYALWPLGVYLLWTATLKMGVEQWAAEDITAMSYLFVLLSLSAWVGGLVEADREWRRLAGRGKPPEVDERWAVMPTKSKVLAWALWAVLGWSGAHRLYCGRWATGLLYCCTFGLLGFGWGYDLFRVASLVEEANRSILASNPARAHVPDTAPTPPPEWAQHQRGSGVLETLGRVGFFVLAPGLLVLVALLTELHIVIALVGVVCVVSAATGDVGRWLEDWSDLEVVPLLGDGMAQLQKIHALYQRIPPRSLFFYLLYPLTAAVTYPFSAQTREEVSVFGRIASSLALLVVLDSVLAWTAQDVAELGLFILAFNIILVVLTLLVTISLGLAAMTSAIRLNLTGHRSALRAYTLLGLLTAVPAGFVWTSMDTPSLRASLVLSTRLQQPGVMADIRNLSRAFLLQREADAPCTPQDSTLRSYIGGLMSPDETLSFDVLCGADGWRGVHIDDQDLTVGLIVAQSPAGQLYEDWADLPPEGQQSLQQARQ